MVNVTVDRQEASQMYVDRNSTANESGREGFTIIVGDVQITFHDEEDAVTLAQMILKRLGEW